MEVVFRTLLGKKIVLSIDNGGSVNGVKRQLEKILQCPSSDITLLLSSQIMDDSLKFSEYNVGKNDFVLIHQFNSLYKPKIGYSTSHSFPRAVEESDFEFKNKQTYKEIEEKVEVIEIEKKDTDPVGFENMVLRFTQMGYEKANVISILRRTNYSEEITSQILISEQEPAAKAPRKEYDVSGLSNYDFGDYTPILDEITNQQKHDLLEVLKQHPNNPGEVLEVFSACDFNIQATLANL